MTKLYFYYSPIYNQTLANIRKSNATPEDKQYGIKYVPRIIKKWYQYNDQVFKYFESEFGHTLPDIWNIYLISYQDQEINFSMPTTVTLTEDFDHMISKIIHELAHLTLFMNETSASNKITVKHWDYIESVFPRSSVEFREHVIVQVMTYFVMKQLYSPEVVKYILARELDYLQGEIGPAWKALYRNDIEHTNLSALDFLLNIKNNSQ